MDIQFLGVLWVGLVAALWVLGAYALILFIKALKIYIKNNS